MRSTTGFDHRVDRQRKPLALQILLQQRLAVLAQGLGIDVLDHRFEQARDHAAAGLEAAVDQHRAEDRFHRVGQDRGPPEAAAFHLALAQTQKVRQRDPLGDLGQR